MNVATLVVELNNKAVGSLLQGDCDSAVSALGTALSSLQIAQEMTVASTGHVPTPAPQHLDVSFALKVLENMSLGDTPICSVPLNHECLNDQCSSGSFSVFSQALTISRSNELEANVTKNYDRILAMVLYNMALSLHFQALRTGKSEELRGALDLYEMSFSVVENAWHLFDVDDLMLLLMALFNNLGHIHSNLYNANQTQICVDSLKALASHPAFLKLMQRDQYAGFSLNLLVVLKQTQQQCSPAA